MPRLALLLVATLVAFRVSAPFAHTHAHGGERVANPGPGLEAHCDGHHRHGAHWHPPGATAAGASGDPAFASTHGHAAVELHAAAVKPSAASIAHPLAVTAARAPAVAAEPGETPPVTATADDPDPPPHAADPTRAPPPLR